jgi:hypothetical protein
MYEKCATTFWCFWSGTSSLRKNFPRLPFVLLFTTFPGCLVYSILPVRRRTVTLCLYTLSFLFCVFIWGDLTGVTYLEHSLHVVYWPGTMFITFWCLI